MKLNDKISKKNPFIVPEGYFDSLADRTMAVIREEEARSQAAGLVDMAPRADKAGGTIRLKPFLALAAAILGFAILATVMVQLVSSDKNAGFYEAGSSLYADLAFEEVDTYIIESELSRTDPEITEVQKDDISSDAIIDYLMNEDIDLNEIYELL